MTLGEKQLVMDRPHFVDVRTLSECRLFRLTREAFWGVLRTSPAVTAEIMRVLATRVQNFEEWSQQREKLVQLGTMAAGLAHELNNPTSAARRSVSELRAVVEQIQNFVCRLSGELSKEQWEKLIDMAKEAAQLKGPRLDSIERSGREEAITSWMDSHEISGGWRLAPTFAAARLDTPALESLLASHLEQRAVPDALCWLDARLTAKSLLATIEESTRRISELVSAVKAYSFMDRAPWQEIDVHTGIESTLTILGHKLKNVVVSRQFDLGLPRICAYGSELNQVWTNVIDNAICATEGKGRIDICTRRDGNHLVVEIADNGRGIPPEVQPRIFEPFFTTKGGAGTGLGLVISYRIVVDRHHGQITFQSRPGETRFEVRLPIDSGGLKKAQ
jgi:signal transduction histidine kinase